MASRPKQAEPRPAPRFYLVTPPVEDADALAAELPAVLGAADVAAVLLRLADGDERSLTNRVKTLAPFVQERGVAVLLDGHANLAARGGADGAHLSGIEEFSAALESLKPDRIAGAGGLASRHDVMVAAETGADYLMFGYRDRHQELPALQERVGWCAEVFELPCVAFAASENEIAPLIAAGADFIALDYIWRDPRGAAKALADTSASLRLPESAQ